MMNRKPLMNSTPYPSRNRFYNVNSTNNAITPSSGIMSPSVSRNSNLSTTSSASSTDEFRYNNKYRGLAKYVLDPRHRPGTPQTGYFSPSSSMSRFHYSSAGNIRNVSNIEKANKHATTGSSTEALHRVRVLPTPLAHSTSSLFKKSQRDLAKENYSSYSTTKAALKTDRKLPVTSARKSPKSKIPLKRHSSPGQLPDKESAKQLLIRDFEIQTKLDLMQLKQSVDFKTAAIRRLVEFHKVSAGYSEKFLKMPLHEFLKRNGDIKSLNFLLIGTARLPLVEKSANEDIGSCSSSKKLGARSIDSGVTSIGNGNDSCRSRSYSTNKSSNANRSAYLKHLELEISACSRDERMSLIQQLERLNIDNE